MRSASALLLALLPVALAAQTAAPAAAKKAVVHHTAAATSTTGALPANVPKVVGVARPLYALRYIDVKVGTGPLAEPSVLGTSQADSKIMFYSVQYTGWLAKDGKKFDSSYDHEDKQPITFPYGAHRVIPGWDTGFDGMHVGGKRRLFIPWQLAYGAQGPPKRPGQEQVIPGKADLIFDIELVSVSDKQPTPPAPPPAPKPTPATPSAPSSPASPSDAPAPPPPPAASPATKPMTDPATNDPAKATTPDNAVPKPGTKPPTP